MQSMPGMVHAARRPRQAGDGALDFLRRLLDPAEVDGSMRADDLNDRLLGAAGGFVLDWIDAHEAAEAGAIVAGDEIGDLFRAAGVDGSSVGLAIFDVRQAGDADAAAPMWPEHGDDEFGGRVPGHNVSSRA